MMSEKIDTGKVNYLKPGKAVLLKVVDHGSCRVFIDPRKDSRGWLRPGGHRLQYVGRDTCVCRAAEIVKTSAPRYTPFNETYERTFTIS